MAGQRHSWKQFMDPAPKYACFAGYEADDYANFQYNNIFRFSSPPSHEDGLVRLAKNWEKLEGLG